MTAEHSQEYYDEIKRRFAEERDLRLAYRPEGTAQFTSELTGDFAPYAADPYVEESVERVIHSSPVAVSTKSTLW